jgi:N-acetylglucosaminyl-diphospho-decaprenol L-rhamnosyltransferase
VVIVNFNGGNFLQAAIDGLAAQTMTDFEVVIIDNASTDRSIEHLSLPDHRFTITQANANIGFAAGSNLGARDATTPWLAMLNPDAIPAPNWLTCLRTATEVHPQITMFGSTQLMANAPDLLDGAGDNYSIFGIAWRGGYGTPANRITSDIEVFSLCAAAALYRRDVFSAANGFAESFFCYLEDVDLCFRLRLLGHRAIQVASARVLHVGSATSGGAFAQYHSTRNGLWLLVRCMPWPLLALALPLYLASQIWLIWRTNDPKARADGLRDGLRTLPAQWPERRRVLKQSRLPLHRLIRILAWSPRAVSQHRIIPISD